jgi:hypothetical protein
MTGLRPLMLCLLALLNTAFWAVILHFLELFVALPLGPAGRAGLLAGIFLFSLVVLLSMSASQPNGDPSDGTGGS